MQEICKELNSQGSPTDSPTDATATPTGDIPTASATDSNGAAKLTGQDWGMLGALALAVAVV